MNIYEANELIIKMIADLNEMDRLFMKSAIGAGSGG